MSATSSARPIPAQGLYTGIGQIVAEEARRSVQEQSPWIMGNTATSVNQGSASGSTGVHLRRQADAHGGRRGPARVLVEMAGREIQRAGRQAHRHRRRHQRRHQQDHLWGADRRALFQRHARLEPGAPATPSTRPARPSPRSRASTRSSASRSSARTSRRKSCARKTTSRTSRCPACCTAESFGRLSRARPPVSVDEKTGQGHPGASRWCGSKDLLGVVADTEWNAIKASLGP